MKFSCYKVLKYLVVFFSAALCYWMNENTIRLLQSDNILPLLTFTIAFNNALNVVLIFFIASRFLMDENDGSWMLENGVSDSEVEEEAAEYEKTKEEKVVNKV